MSDALYERYKDALRRGHVAALRGRPDAALAAYGEAATLAPDRALPLTGIGAVLLRLDRLPEALAAYDGALDRAADDETAMRGRADVLVAMGDRAEAAAMLDRLAASLEIAGRVPAAMDAARAALELAESRGRRSQLRALVDRARAEGATDAASVAALEAATSVLTAADPTAAGVATDGAGTEPPEPPPPPFDAAAAVAAVEAAIDAGDHESVRQLALEAVDGHRAAGSVSAAIDVCYLALADSPAEPALHLALTEAYLDRGWRALAGEKLVLLHRIAELDDDALTRDRIRAIAMGRLADDPRLAAVIT